MEKVSLNFHQIVELQSLVETEITKLSQYKKAEEDKAKIKIVNDSLKRKKAIKKTLDAIYKEY